MEPSIPPERKEKWSTSILRYAGILGLLTVIELVIGEKLSTRDPGPINYRTQCFALLILIALAGIGFLLRAWENRKKR